MASPIPDTLTNNNVVQCSVWFFTFNNPSRIPNYAGPTDILRHLHNRLGVTISKSVFQLEQGKQGTEHIQGVFVCNPKVRKQTMLNKSRGTGFYIAPCISWKGAVEYCRKSDTRISGPFHFGCTPETALEPVQGNRTDLMVVAEIAKGGGTLRDVALSCPTAYIKYSGGISKYFSIIGDKKRDFMTELYIYYGPTGTGKSHTAKIIAENRGGGSYYLRVPRSTLDKVWWDGYNGEENIIIDDFYGSISLHYFLNLIDKYPMQLEIKGGMAQMLGKRVFITSNSKWTEWWDNKIMLAHFEAFERRITFIEHRTQRYQEVEELHPTY